MTTSNPFLGHAVERSWPLIFGAYPPEVDLVPVHPDPVLSLSGCNDLDLVRRCKDNTYDSDVCQCLDL